MTNKMATLKSIAKAYNVARSTSLIKLSDFIRSLSKEEKALCKGRSSEIREELKRMWDLESDLAKAKSLKISLKRFSEIEYKAYVIAKHFKGCTGYSMGDVISIHVSYSCRENGKMVTNSIYLDSYSCANPYSASSGYKAKHGYMSIRLTVPEILKAEIIGGLLTIPFSKNKISECKYLVLRGTKQNLRQDWITGYTTSTYHAKSYEACVKWREASVKRLLAERQKAVIAKLTVEKKAELLEKAKSRYVGYQHSRNAGNCHDGTLAFAQRHNLNPNFGYQLGFILSLEDTQFTRRLQNLFV